MQLPQVQSAVTKQPAHKNPVASYRLPIRGHRNEHRRIRLKNWIYDRSYTLKHLWLNSHTLAMALSYRPGTPLSRGASLWGDPSYVNLLAASFAQAPPEANSSATMAGKRGKTLHHTAPEPIHLSQQTALSLQVHPATWGRSQGSKGSLPSLAPQ